MRVLMIFLLVFAMVLIPLINTTNAEYYHEYKKNYFEEKVDEKFQSWKYYSEIRSSMIQIVDFPSVACERIILPNGTDFFVVLEFEEENKNPNIIFNEKRDSNCYVLGEPHQPDSSKIFSVLSPYQQIKKGLAYSEIECKENLVLIKKYDGSPACVTEPTKQKLIERGWTKDVMDYTNSHPCQKLAFEAFANTTLKRASNTDSDLSVGYGDGENEEFLRSIGCYENRKEWQTQEFLDYLNELLKNKIKFP